MCLPVSCFRSYSTYFFGNINILYKRIIDNLKYKIKSSREQIILKDVHLNEKILFFQKLSKISTFNENFVIAYKNFTSCLLLNKVMSMTNKTSGLLADYPYAKLENMGLMCLPSANILKYHNL